MRLDDRSARPAWAVVAFLGLTTLAACPATPEPDAGPDTEDASLDGASLDGASLDGASLDGASLDGASLDGASLDGASLDGASLDASWGVCSVGGVAGTCIDMALCTADRMPVMGYCPGPSAIQCCIPRTDGEIGRASCRERVS
jgi:hypothetical protein